MINVVNKETMMSSEYKDISAITRSKQEQGNTKEII